MAALKLVINTLNCRQLMRSQAGFYGWSAVCTFPADLCPKGLLETSVKSAKASNRISWCIHSSAKPPTAVKPDVTSREILFRNQLSFFQVQPAETNLSFSITEVFGCGLLRISSMLVTSLTDHHPLAGRSLHLRSLHTLRRYIRFTFHSDALWDHFKPHHPKCGLLILLHLLPMEVQEEGQVIVQVELQKQTTR